MTAKDSSGAERRHFHRVTFDETVEVACGEALFKGRLIDLSLQGALAEFDNGTAPLEVGSLCNLLINLSGEAHIAMEAKVAHIEDEHVGFHCEHIDLESVQHLRRLVELNLGDDELLHRDLAAMVEQLP